MIIKSLIDYPAVTGMEKRRLYVYLPNSYQYEEERRYPVLYMFDGQNVFFDKDATYGKSWGVGKYLDHTGTELIFVAVECSSAEDNERLSEYSPWTFEDPVYGFHEGRGELTMQWFVNKLMPKINRKYRTLRGRDNTYIMGSSMGGLMSLYAVLRYNRVFSCCAALSPSIELVPEDIKNFVKKCRVKRDTVIYMDYGTEEAKDYKGVMNAFAALTRQLMQKGIMVTSRVVPYGPHNEATWEKQLPFAIGAMMYNP
ncbi:MAG: alpha/beta hydrolase-fold protein [Clostridia bacterium]|nr:alpha/beta hydrolase-fold protein [Clostridia bacterium]